MSKVSKTKREETAKQNELDRIERKNQCQVARACAEWERIIRQELIHAVTEERQPWLKGKIYYSLMKSAGYNFIYYLEKPQYRESALVMALCLREMAQGFDHDRLKPEELALAVAQKLIPIGEEAATVERPDWISEEDWQQAQHDSTHDEADNLLRPKLEGFLTGAFYKMPCIHDSEFDDDRVFKSIQAAVNAASSKAQQDYMYNLKQYTKPNSSKWKAIWMNKLYDSKDDKDVCEKFVERHSMEYDS